MLETIIILILLLILCVIKLNKYNNEKTLHKYICFCCAQSDNQHRANISLYGHILNVQNDLQSNMRIKKEYRLVWDDKQYINEILAKFADDLLQSYFDNGLDVGIKEIVKLSDKEFLMLYLWNFLRKDHNFDPEKMYTYRKVPDGEYYRELHLTDFSLAYYKLFYITQLYCHNSTNIMKRFPDLCYEHPEGTKEIIDSKIKKDYTR